MIQYIIMSLVKKDDFMRCVFNNAYAIFYSNLLYKNMCSWYSVKLPQHVETILFSSCIICFYKEVDKSTQAVICRL